MPLLRDISYIIRLNGKHNKVKMKMAEMYLKKCPFIKFTGSYISSVFFSENSKGGNKWRRILLKVWKGSYLGKTCKLLPKKMAYGERQRKQKSQRRVFKSLNQRPSIIQITSELQW